MQRINHYSYLRYTGTEISWTYNNVINMSKRKRKTV